MPKQQDCLDSCQPLPIKKCKSIGIGQNTTKFDRPVPMPEKKADTTDTDTVGASLIIMVVLISLCVSFGVEEGCRCNGWSVSLCVVHNVTTQLLPIVLASGSWYACS